MHILYYLLYLFLYINQFFLLFFLNHSIQILYQNIDYSKKYSLNFIKEITLKIIKNNSLNKIIKPTSLTIPVILRHLTISGNFRMA